MHSTKTHLNRGFNPPHETETQTREEKKKKEMNFAFIYHCCRGTTWKWIPNTQQNEKQLK